VFHQKTYCIAASAAAKTFIDFLGRGYGEGRRFFVVKGAKPQVISPSFLEPDKAADDFGDIDATYNLLYGLLSNQIG
jgi:hypothetical protein